MAIRIAINGYGRIGRNVHRLALKTPDIEVVAINSRAESDSHVYLLKYDSLYGQLEADVKVKGENMEVNGKEILVYQKDDPADLAWEKVGVDVVIESTGKFTSRVDAERHLLAGAKKVLITAPCKEREIPNIVLGVNEKEYRPQEYAIVSNASCTTNCFGTVAKVLHQEFGIENAFVTTMHAFTCKQNLLDNSNPGDFRRSRATMESLIPTTTGATDVIGRVIPELEGRLDGMSIRVPIPTVSSIDLVANLKKSVSREQVNQAFKKYESGELAGILGTSDEPLVSVDFRGDSRSSIVDTLSTKVLSGSFVNLLAWYDNEWGYASRVIDLIRWLKAPEN